MQYTIGILTERLTRLEHGWTEFVTSGKVSENSPIAQRQKKEAEELRTAIKILTNAIDTRENNCNLHIVSGMLPIAFAKWIRNNTTTDGCEKLLYNGTRKTIEELYELYTLIAE